MNGRIACRGIVAHLEAKIHSDPEFLHSDPEFLHVAPSRGKEPNCALLRLAVVAALLLGGLSILPVGFSFADETMPDDVVVGTWVGFIRDDGRSRILHRFRVKIEKNGGEIEYDGGRCKAVLMYKGENDKQYSYFQQVTYKNNNNDGSLFQPLTCGDGNITVKKEKNFLRFSAAIDGDSLRGTLSTTVCVGTIGTCDRMLPSYRMNLYGNQVAEEIERFDESQEVARNVWFTSTKNYSTGQWHHLIYVRLNHPGDFYYLDQDKSASRTATPLSRTIKHVDVGPCPPQFPRNCYADEYYSIELSGEDFRSAADQGISTKFAAADGTIVEVSLPSDSVATRLEKIDQSVQFARQHPVGVRSP